MESTANVLGVETCWVGLTLTFLSAIQFILPALYDYDKLCSDWGPRVNVHLLPCPALIILNTWHHWFSTKILCFRWLHLRDRSSDWNKRHLASAIGGINLRVSLGSTCASDDAAAVVDGTTNLTLVAVFLLLVPLRQAVQRWSRKPLSCGLHAKAVYMHDL